MRSCTTSATIMKFPAAAWAARWGSPPLGIGGLTTSD